MSNCRFPTIYLQIFFCIILCIGAPARADNQHDLRQKIFEMDKAAALADFDAAQKQACVQALNARYPSQYALSETLALNEAFSQAAYDRLFWKGEGNLQRGLLFTGSVTDQSGSKAGNLVCYYAITDYRLEFQSAYVLPLQAAKAKAASGVNEDVPSSSITLASRE